MKPTKRQRKIVYLRFITSALKNWDFLTKHNDGFFSGKIALNTSKGQRIFTQKDLISHIEQVKRT